MLKYIYIKESTSFPDLFFVHNVLFVQEVVTHLIHNIFVCNEVFLNIRIGKVENHFFAT